MSFFLDFLRKLNANSVKVPEIRTVQCSSTIIPLHHSLITMSVDALRCDMLTASEISPWINEQWQWRHSRCHLLNTTYLSTLN